MFLCACKVYDPQYAQETSEQRAFPDAADPDPVPVADRKGCHWNSDPEKAMRCPVVCPETCNGSDDDCDGSIDEGKDDALCDIAHAEAVCRQGECFVTRCLDDYRDCDALAATGCEVGPEDPSHCGGCGRQCDLTQAVARCVDGNCRIASCRPGYGDCDSDEVSCETKTVTLTDCSGCNTPCQDLPHAVPTCQSGQCAIASCLAGYGDCDGRSDNGCEQPLDTLQHCGACNQHCAKASCGGGTCTAVDCGKLPGRADCDGDQASCEVDLSHDVLHCGRCGNACRFDSETKTHARVACESSRCVAACDPGWGDCDGNYANGCEQPLNTADHCGACRSGCAIDHATVSCETGRCQVVSCKDELDDCDRDKLSCETSLATPGACGGCDKRCDLDHANQTCGGSTGARVCTLASCENGFADCDANPENGCERDTRAPEAGGQGPCVPDTRCTRVSADGRDYFFCTTERSWDDARSRCRSQRGGDLVHIESAAERDLLLPRLTTRNWIGFGDRDRAGLWTWMYNAVPFWRGNRGGSAVAGRFASWASGEPNDSGDCGALYANGGFDDLDCTRGQPFICEVSPDTCPDDPAKSDPSQCGCGKLDTDTDGDGVANCP